MFKLHNKFYSDKWALELLTMVDTDLNGKFT